MTTEHDQGDYVLVHKSKAKISRARKMIIGVMAIGAVAAMTNAGTFASFGATTTNDAQFKTGRLVLSNTANGGNACFSSGTAAGATSTSDANLDSNDTSCDAILALQQQPGVTATGQVTVVNSGTYANGKLYVFSPDADPCVSTVRTDTSFTIGGTGNLCDTHMYVQEFTSAAMTVPVTGCIFPKNTATNCNFAGIEDTTPTTDDGTWDKMDDFTAEFGSGAAPRDLGAFNQSSSRFFGVVYLLPSTALNATTGAAPDNVYQNLKAALTIKWLLQDQ